MSKFSNELTDAQLERLAFLLEECGEVVQMAGKTIRHGYESTAPAEDNRSGPTNREYLQEEIGNVLAAVDIMTASGDLNLEKIESAKAAKLTEVWKWMHHQ